MTYEPNTMASPEAIASEHRQYSLDQIRSLLQQAAGIAEQEGFALLQQALHIVRDASVFCCK